jgi:4-amino-4-deoxy-L-arabinose transferase-like glycosyltransferase
LPQKKNRRLTPPYSTAKLPQRLNTRKRTYQNWLYLAAILLLGPALLINLGLMTFIDDEGIRSLVALEMQFSGNYITPTLHGEYYYNKPPLYNWILILFFELGGQASEFMARLPTVLCLLGFAATIYYYSRKHFSREFAFLNAFFYITCGRVLFWDSMLGLIDTAFSWAMFTLFMVIYHQFQKGNWLRLFLFSYSLAALGFMMKGLPSVVFQGTTLLVYFTYRRRFWQLFSWQHLLGGLVFIAIVGGYYLVYNSYNSLENVFPVLFSESSKRTVTHFGWWESIKHFFAFPFEMVYHFLPWALMILYFLRRDIVAIIRQDSFVVFCLIAFLANILVYWASPEVYPRYLLMLAPLIFTAYLYLHLQHEAERSWQYRVINAFFFVFCVVAAAGAFALPFIERLSWLPLVTAKSIGLGLALLALTYAYWRLPQKRLLVLVLVLLSFRIGFNWFVLPDRNAHDFGDECRQTTIEAGRQFLGQPLFVYKDTEMQITNSFYLTKERGSIVPRKHSDFDSTSLYIIDPGAFRGLEYEKVGDFRLRHDTLTFDIGKLKLK